MTAKTFIDHPAAEEMILSGQSLSEFLCFLQDSGQYLPQLEINDRVVVSKRFPPSREMPEGRCIGQAFGRRFYAQPQPVGAQ